VIAETELARVLAFVIRVATRVVRLPAEIWDTPSAKVSRRMFADSRVDMMMPV